MLKILVISLFLTACGVRNFDSGNQNGEINNGYYCQIGRDALSRSGEVVEISGSYRSDQLHSVFRPDGCQYSTITLIVNGLTSQERAAFEELLLSQRGDSVGFVTTLLRVKGQVRLSPSGDGYEFLVSDVQDVRGLRH